MQDHNYYVYITTNKNKTVLYTGVTGALIQRIGLHTEQAKQHGHPAFTARYNAYFVMYCEHFRDVNAAIAREKQIKGWKREKKELLVQTMNPGWRFLNDELTGLEIAP